MKRSVRGVFEIGSSDSIFYSLFISDEENPLQYKHHSLELGNFVCRKQVAKEDVYKEKWYNIDCP